MSSITRSQWYSEKIALFLKDFSASSISLLLYANEIKKIGRVWDVCIQKGKPIGQRTHIRYNCLITKKI